MLTVSRCCSCFGLNVADAAHRHCNLIFSSCASCVQTHWSSTIVSMRRYCARGLLAMRNALMRTLAISHTPLLDDDASCSRDRRPLPPTRRLLRWRQQAPWRPHSAAEFLVARSQREVQPPAPGSMNGSLKSLGTARTIPRHVSSSSLNAWLH